MIRYPSPDAYDRPHAFSVIPEDQEQHSSWTWRSLAGLAAYKATTWTGYYAGRLPLKTKTNYLDLGIAHAGLTWKSMVGGKTQIQDWVLNLIKGFEEETPFHLGRTFGLTEFLSPYVLGNRVDLKIPKDIVNAHHNYYRTLIQRVSDVDQTGQPITRGLRDQDWAGGMHLRGGKLYGILETGEEKELLGFARPRLAHWYPPKVQGIKHPPLHGRLSEAYQQILARSRGGGSRRLIQDDKFPFHIVGSARSRNILGFDVPWRHYLREAQSVAEMWNRRFFKLLDSPVELLKSAGAQTESIPGLTRVASFVDKIGLTNRLGLGGDYSGNILQQWGRWLRPGMGKSSFRPGALLTFVGLPFAYHAVDQYLRGREELKGTLVEHGLGGAAANVWQKLMLGRARFGQLSGLSAIARAQESVAPNSTDPATMLGLPLGIGIIGGIYGFGASRLNRQDGIEKVWQRIKLPEHEFTGALRRFFSGKYTRSGKLFRGGLAIGAVLEAPFLLGAAARFLGGLKSPEDLKRIYSGEEEIPVRHGRLWEFGSCIGSLTEIPTSFTETKFASDIIEGDLIIGSNGKSARVKHVWSRHHQGNILKIITAIDRYRPTWLTDNHIVPAIKKIDLKNDPKRTKVQPQEIPAGELQPGDFVQVPLFKLPSRRYNLLDLKNFIKCGLVLESNNRLYPAQQNWKHHRTQKSQGFSLPKQIHVDQRIARLFGYFLAEGNLVFNKYGLPCCIETVHAKQEKWIVDDIASTIKDIFGFSPTYKLRNSDKGAKEGCWIVRIQSSLLARIFFELFYSSDRLADKHFPDIFFNFSDDVLLQIVEGYWRGDGHNNAIRVDSDDNHYQTLRRTIKSSRPQLIYAVQTILLHNGYWATIHYDENGFKGEWMLSWNPKVVFQEQPYFLHDEGNLYIQIVSIEQEKYNDLVYDFEIESHDHLFQAGAFLIHNSHYKGTKVDYYRPHWTVLAKSNYYAKSLFKGDESALFKAAKMTPILSDIVDPYYLEKLHFYDRPYPTTGPSYPGLSIMGSLYAGTLGKLFKPERTMHEEEWQVPGGIVAPAEDYAPIPELGGLPPEMPVSGYSLTQVGPEIVHRWAEAIGLPGWLGRLVTGADNWGAGSQFASAEQINSERRRYWDENLGGLMGNTEWYRRINPSLRRSITEQQYNPLRNTMPSWLPGPEDNFIDFRHGDPMAKIPQGEARLPGPGYAALHPELEGVDPENYPFLTRYKILADVAPYSKEAKEYAARATAMDQAGTLTPEEHLQVMDIKRKLSLVKKRKEFFDHQDFTERNLLGRGLGRYWETLSHDVEDLDVVEPLLPFRPLAKFIHQRDALEDYAMTQVYGTDAGFWNKPWVNFLRPAKERLDEHLGDERIPQHVQTLRNTEEYFDRLKYLKTQMHARLARNAGDFDSAQAWLKASKKTLTGAQPYGSREDMLAIMEALPKRERDYYTEFSEETDPERREKILELVPEQVGRIYRLTWEADALRRTREAEAQGIIDASTSEVQNIEQALQVDLQTGGRLTPELLNQYQQEGTKQPLPEWLLEQELQLYFQDHPLPAAQSLIWDPRIDLEDVKLKVVTQEGADHHDYDIWDTQARAAKRKPYLDNITEDLNEERSPEEIRRQIRAICEGQGIEDLQVEVVPAGLSTSQVILTNNPDDDLRQRLFSIEHADRRPVRSAPPPRRQQRGRQPNERPL